MSRKKECVVVEVDLATLRSKVERLEVSDDRIRLHILVEPLFLSELGKYSVLLDEAYIRLVVAKLFEEAVR